MNTKLQYSYQSELGDKLFSHEFVLAGEIAEVDLRRLWDSLRNEGSSALFIPSRVGLMALSPIRDNTFDALVAALDTAESEESRRAIDMHDHPWHELIFIEMTYLPPTLELSAKAFLERALEWSFKDLAPPTGGR